MTLRAITFFGWRQPRRHCARQGKQLPPLLTGRLLRGMSDSVLTTTLPVRG